MFVVADRVDFGQSALNAQKVSAALEQRAPSLLMVKSGIPVQHACKRVRLRSRRCRRVYSQHNALTSIAFTIAESDSVKPKTTRSTDLFLSSVKTSPKALAASAWQSAQPKAAYHVLVALLMGLLSMLTQLALSGALPSASPEMPGLLAVVVTSNESTLSAENTEGSRTLAASNVRLASTLAERTKRVSFSTMRNHSRANAEHPTPKPLLVDALTLAAKANWTSEQESKGSLSTIQSHSQLSSSRHGSTMSAIVVATSFRAVTFTTSAAAAGIPFVKTTTVAVATTPAVAMLHGAFPIAPTFPPPSKAPQALNIEATSVPLFHVRATSFELSLPPKFTVFLLFKRQWLNLQPRTTQQRRRRRTRRKDDANTRHILSAVTYRHVGPFVPQHLNLCERTYHLAEALAIALNTTNDAHAALGLSAFILEPQGLVLNLAGRRLTTRVKCCQQSDNRSHQRPRRCLVNWYTSNRCRFFNVQHVTARSNRPATTSRPSTLRRERTPSLWSSLRTGYQREAMLLLQRSVRERLFDNGSKHQLIVASYSIKKREAVKFSQIHLLTTRLEYEVESDDLLKAPSRQRQRHKLNQVKAQQLNSENSHKIQFSTEPEAAQHAGKPQMPPELAAFLCRVVARDYKTIAEDSKRVFLHMFLQTQLSCTVLQQTSAVAKRHKRTDVFNAKKVFEWFPYPSIEALRYGLSLWRNTLPLTSNIFFLKKHNTSTTCIPIKCMSKVDFFSNRKIGTIKRCFKTQKQLKKLKICTWLTFFLGCTSDRSDKTVRICCSLLFMADRSADEDSRKNSFQGNNFTGIRLNPGVIPYKRINGGNTLASKPPMLTLQRQRLTSESGEIWDSRQQLNSREQTRDTSATCALLHFQRQAVGFIKKLSQTGGLLWCLYSKSNYSSLGTTKSSLTGWHRLSCNLVRNLRLLDKRHRVNKWCVRQKHFADRQTEVFSSDKYIDLQGGTRLEPIQNVSSELNVSAVFAPAFLSRWPPGDRRLSGKTAKTEARSRLTSTAQRANLPEKRPARSSFHYQEHDGPAVQDEASFIWLSRPSRHILPFRHFANPLVERIKNRFVVASNHHVVNKLGRADFKVFASFRSKIPVSHKRRKVSGYTSVTSGGAGGRVSRESSFESHYRTTRKKPNRKILLKRHAPPGESVFSTKSTHSNLRSSASGAGEPARRISAAEFKLNRERGGRSLHRQNCSMLLDEGYLPTGPETFLVLGRWGVLLCCMETGMVLMTLAVFSRECVYLYHTWPLRAALFSCGALSVFPFTALCALAAAIFPHMYDVASALVMLYLPLSLVMYYELVATYAGGSHILWELLADQRMPLKGPPLCCVLPPCCGKPGPILTRKRQRLMRCFIYQLLGVPVLLVGIIMICTLAGVHPGDRLEATNASPYLMMVQALSFVFGTYALVICVKLAARHLPHHALRRKFTVFHLHYTITRLQVIFFKLTGLTASLPCIPPLSSMASGIYMSCAMLIGQCFLMSTVSQYFFLHRPPTGSTCVHLPLDVDALDGGRRPPLWQCRAVVESDRCARPTGSFAAAAVRQGSVEPRTIADFVAGETFSSSELRPKNRALVAAARHASLQGSSSVVESNRCTLSRALSHPVTRAGSSGVGLTTGTGNDYSLSAHTRRDTQVSPKATGVSTAAVAASPAATAERRVDSSQRAAKTLARAKLRLDLGDKMRPARGVSSATTLGVAAPNLAKMAMTRAQEKGGLQMSVAVGGALEAVHKRYLRHARRSQQQLAFPRSAYFNCMEGDVNSTAIPLEAASWQASTMRSFDSSADAAVCVPTAAVNVLNTAEEQRQLAAMKSLLEKRAADRAFYANLERRLAEFALLGRQNSIDESVSRCAFDRSSARRRAEDKAARRTAFELFRERPLMTRSLDDALRSRERRWQRVTLSDAGDRWHNLLAEHSNLLFSSPVNAPPSAPTSPTLLLSSHWTQEAATRPMDCASRSATDGLAALHTLPEKCERADAVEEHAGLAFGATSGFHSSGDSPLRQAYHIWSRCSADWERQHGVQLPPSVERLMHFVQLAELDQHLQASVSDGVAAHSPEGSVASNHLCQRDPIRRPN